MSQLSEQELNILENGCMVQAANQRRAAEEIRRLRAELENEKAIALLERGKKIHAYQFIRSLCGELDSRCDDFNQLDPFLESSTDEQLLSLLNKLRLMLRSGVVQGDTTVHMTKEAFEELLEANRERDEARATNVKLVGMFRAVDMELSDGEQGPSETICKIAEVMENYLRMPPNPGQPLIDEIQALRVRLAALERVTRLFMARYEYRPDVRRELRLADVERHDQTEILDLGKGALAAALKEAPGLTN